jgi:hypothetical protein
MYWRVKWNNSVMRCTKVGLFQLVLKQNPFAQEVKVSKKQVSEDPINSDLWMAHNADKTYAITP